MKRELYDVQKTHAHRLTTALLKYKAALDASDTGCGKTLVAAEIAAELRRPTFIVCLKSSIPMWEKETKDRGWPALDVVNYELLRRGRTKWGTWAARKIWTWKLSNDALIIWDEVQKCQGFDSLNSKMLIGSKPYTNLLLSASAAEDPTEMRASGYLLGLHSLRDFWSWCKSNGCNPGQFGGLEFGKELNVKYDEILAKLHYRLFPDHGSRLTVTDLKDHFQDTQIITTPLDFGPEVKKIYKEMEAELSNLKEVMLSDSPSAEALVRMLRARQQAELCKTPTMIEMAEDLLREGRSVVIFVNFEATIQALNSRLAGARIISGKTSDNRQETIDAFQSDECRLLICNVQAGGVSVSLHDLNGNHPRTAIISPSWNAKDILQTLGRVHRAGGKTPSQQHILFASGTIEEDVEQAVRTKMRRIDLLNEGDENSVAAQVKKVSKIVDADPDISETNITVKKEKTPTAVVGDTPVPEKDHAQFSPSSLGMFEKCPGFLNRNEETESSLKGTRIHHALEKDTIDELDDDERPLARKCQDWIDGAIAERLPTLPDKHYREIKLNIYLGAGLKTFGTCDRLLVYGKFGLMIDFKTGHLAVTDAEQNAQAFAYVIGAFQKFSELDEIQFVFLLPTRDEESGHLFKRSDIPEMQLRLSTIIRRAMDADPKLFSPQPELCEYCARQSMCPRLAEKALKIAAKLGPGLPVPVGHLVDKAKPEDIPHLLRLAPLMEAWAQGVRDAALKLNLEEGIEVPGFVRQTRKTPRAVTSVMGAWEAIKDQISLEEFLLTCSKVSMPQLEDLVAEKATYGEKGKARKDLENNLRHRDLLREESEYYFLRESKK